MVMFIRATFRHQSTKQVLSSCQRVKCTMLGKTYNSSRSRLLKKLSLNINFIQAQLHYSRSCCFYSIDSSDRLKWRTVQKSLSSYKYCTVVTPEKGTAADHTICCRYCCSLGKLHLEQIWALYGPRATRSPLLDSDWPPLGEL